MTERSYRKTITLNNTKSLKKKTTSKQQQKKNPQNAYWVSNIEHFYSAVTCHHRKVQSLCHLLLFTINGPVFKTWAATRATFILCLHMVFCQVIPQNYCCQYILFYPRVAKVLDGTSNCIVYNYKLELLVSFLKLWH